MAKSFPLIFEWIYYQESEKGSLCTWVFPIDSQIPLIYHPIFLSPQSEAPAPLFKTIYMQNWLYFFEQLILHLLFQKIFW